MGTADAIRGKCWFLDSEPLLWGVRGPQQEICFSPFSSSYGEENQVYSLEVLAVHTLGILVAKIDVLSKQEPEPSWPLPTVFAVS